MKTFVPFRLPVLKFVFLLIVMTSAIVSQAQELVFKNSTLEPGSPAAGSNGCIYRFPSVKTNVDALVKINGRSSALVTLSNIDVTSSGYDKAFQPQIAYNNGNVNGAVNWWMEFVITFVNTNTTTPVAITTFNATALDLDGNSSRLHEWATFYYPASYTLESPSGLSVSNLVQMLLGVPTNVGNTFDGVITDHSGIDTFATDLMVTTRYNNVNTITYRAGGSTTGSTSGANRQYSVYFKNFNYNSPIITLPVKLESFTANLDGDKVDLKWITSREINVSHFAIEKSYDGKNFTEAGVVFSYGNTSEKINYTFSDNINNLQQGIIYYRLRSVDNDGRSQLSEVRVIRMSKQSETLRMVTYPNPVSNELRVTVPAAWQGKTLIVEVFNPAGQKVKTFKSGNASQTEAIIVSDLTKGFYLVKASCGPETAQQKVIKN